MGIPGEQRPATVSTTKQAGEAPNGKWEWVERTVWTDRMLEALDKGVKGGVWFSLIDKVYRPRVLAAAWQHVKRKGRAVGSDHQSLEQFERLLKAGHRWVVDDFVILCKSRQQAEAALSRVTELVEQRGLTLHADKTSVVDTGQVDEGFEFLGYRFENGTRRPRKKSLKQFKETIRGKTRRSNGRSMAKIVADVSRTNKGWFEYFKHSHRTTFKPLDGWIRRRLRSILRGYHKQKGISRGWDNRRWPNQYFRDLGYFSLHDAHRALLQSS